MDRPTLTEKGTLAIQSKMKGNAIPSIAAQAEISAGLGKGIAFVSAQTVISHMERALD